MSARQMVMVTLPAEIVMELRRRAQRLGWSPEKYVAGLCIADFRGAIGGARRGARKVETSSEEVLRDLQDLEILLS